MHQALRGAQATGSTRTPNQSAGSAGLWAGATGARTRPGRSRPVIARAKGAAWPRVNEAAASRAHPLPGPRYPETAVRDAGARPQRCGAKRAVSLPARLRALLWALLPLLIGLGLARPVAAQTRLKGIAGGALVGSQVVLLAESGFTVPRWAYLAGGGAGLVGGGVAGYFLSRGDSERPAVYLLGAGVTLIVPTVLAVVSALRREYPDKQRLDAARSAPRAARSWVALHPRAAPTLGLQWLPPSLTVAPLFGAQEPTWRTGAQGTQAQLTLRGRF